ncbi:aldehyde dehydrogenase family protein, partial [Sphingobium sp. H39-3-25]|nr:aldehyde dehydrogenase family protein [Sphingobium arseniciresistens]
MKTKLFINDAWIDSGDKKYFDRKHPVSGETMTQCANATVADAGKAAQSAQEAFKSWKAVGPSERRRLLLKVAEVMESKTPEFIKVMAKEVGASALWAGFNVHLSANVFR